MARRVHVLVSLLALTVAVGVGLHWPVNHAAAQFPLGANDAGSGTDAGNAPDLALLIPTARRMWSANLTPTGTDSDWYRLSAADAFCASVDGTVQSPGYLTLASSTTLEASAFREAMPHRATRLSLAAPAGHVPLFGVDPPTTRFTAEATDSNNQPSPGRYTFAFAARTYGELDPEGDGEWPEAGAAPDASAALPTDCSAGRLRSAAGDVEDRYHLDVADARLLTLSFAVARGDAATLRVVSPSGQTHAVLESGSVADVWAGESGRWTLLVAYPPAEATLLQRTLALSTAAPSSTLLETAYLLGVTDGPGDTEPCRPSCLG